MAEARPNGVAIVQERIAVLQTVTEDSFKAVQATLAKLEKENTELKEILITLTGKIEKIETAVTKLGVAGAVKRNNAKKTAAKDAEIFPTVDTLDLYIEHLLANGAEHLDSLLGAAVLEKLSNYRQSKQYTELPTATKRSDAELRYITKVLFSEHPDIKTKVETDRLNFIKQNEATKKAMRAPVEAPKEADPASSE